MVPSEFDNFFLASTGAGAALVGLLFVAVSIAPEHIVMAGAPIERRAVAGSSFSALLNAFFISLGALIPGTNLVAITLIMSVIGLVSTLSMGWTLLRHLSDWQNTLRRTFIILVGLGIYGYEMYCAIAIIQFPHDPSPVFTLTALLMAVYGLGLIRAWELLGMRRYGLLTWLNPLHEVDDRKPEPVTETDRLHMGE